MQNENPIKSLPACNHPWLPIASVPQHSISGPGLLPLCHYLLYSVPQGACSLHPLTLSLSLSLSLTHTHTHTHTHTVLGLPPTSSSQRLCPPGLQWSLLGRTPAAHGASTFCSHNRIWTLLLICCLFHPLGTPQGKVHHGCLALCCIPSPGPGPCTC